jgi:hypothetical protein
MAKLARRALANEKGIAGCERRSDPFCDPPKVGTPELGNSASQCLKYRSGRVLSLCDESHSGGSGTEMRIFVIPITAAKSASSNLTLAKF